MKENGHNDLDKLLKEQLGDRQAGVPEFVWEKIEERIYPEKKRRGFFWWWFFGAGLLVIAGAWGVIEMESGRRLTAGREDVNDRYSVVVRGNDENEEKPDHQVDFSPNPNTSRTSRDISGSREEIDNRWNYWNSPNLLDKKTITPSSTNDLGTWEIAGSPEGGANDRKGIEKSGDGDKEMQLSASQNPPRHEILQRKMATLRAQHTVAACFQALTLSVTQPTIPSHPTAQLLPKTPLHGNTDTLFPLPKPDMQTLSPFSILAYGGPSFYDMANLRPYFETGQLSHRTFDASGFEAGLGVSFRISDRFSVYALGSFNRKQASYRYTLAITEDAYFNYVLAGEQLPLENISDNANDNCFLARDATASYTVSTWSTAIGANFTVLQFGNWSFDADLRFSVNAASNLNVRETTVIALSNPEKEHFSWCQPGAGLTVRCQLNKRLSVGIAPLYSHRFHLDDPSFSKKLNELIVPVTLRIGI